VAYAKDRRYHFLEIARRIREFDARSEVNVYLAESETVVTGQPIQTRVTPFTRSEVYLRKE